MMVSASIVISLTGCVHSGSNASLATIPGDIQVCFDKTVPKPPPGELKQSDMVRLVADLKRSEQAKTLCGKRLIAWYENQATELAK